MRSHQKQKMIVFGANIRMPNKISIDRNSIDKSLDFSKKIILENDQYNRFDKSSKIQIERTFVGKLAEVAFINFFKEIKVPIKIDDLFAIFKGSENVDKFDIQFSNGKIADVKCASKPFHKRIMVPIDQFNNLKKDYYLGIKLNFELDEKKMIIPHSIKEGLIYGYIVREKLEKSSTANFGEGYCKHELLENLDPIEELVKDVS